MKAEVRRHIRGAGFSCKWLVGSGKMEKKRNLLSKVPGMRLDFGLTVAV